MLKESYLLKFQLGTFQTQETIGSICFSEEMT